jgi:hypothetical protein
LPVFLSVIASKIHFREYLIVEYHLIRSGAKCGGEAVPVVKNVVVYKGRGAVSI